MHRQVGPHALLSDHYIADKNLFAAMIKGTEEEDSVVVAEDSALNVKRLLAQYLASLKCSYAAQFNQALLSPLAYREIMTAVCAAIDYVADQDEDEDSKVEVSEDKFEWRWLEEMGFLDIPRWLTFVSGLVESSALDSVISRQWRQDLITAWTRVERARCVEIALAVKKAHEDTLQVEQSMLNELPSRFKEVLRTSRSIRRKAEARYADFQCNEPALCCAVRTRQSCQLVLDKMHQEFEILHGTGQIGNADFETYEVYQYNPSANTLKRASARAHTAHHTHTHPYARTRSLGVGITNFLPNASISIIHMHMHIYIHIHLYFSLSRARARPPVRAISSFFLSLPPHPSSSPAPSSSRKSRSTSASIL